MNSNTQVVKEEPFPSNPQEGDTHTSGASGITYIFEKRRWRPIK